MSAGRYVPGRGRGGLDTSAVERLRQRRAAGSALPGEADNQQANLLLGGGAKKVARCGHCTRPLLEGDVGHVCSRCEQPGAPRSAPAAPAAPAPPAPPPPPAPPAPLPAPLPAVTEQPLSWQEAVARAQRERKRLRGAEERDVAAILALLAEHACPIGCPITHAS